MSPIRAWVRLTLEYSCCMHILELNGRTALSPDPALCEGLEALLSDCGLREQMASQSFRQRANVA